ncbi:MAG: hypothetical protein R8G66_26910 [Cytophagales bacterium]|nr:hypothetical protein [Cytophagales bacterium]
MRTLLLLVITAIITVSCTDETEIPSVDLTEYNFYQDALLSNSYPYIVGGNDLVFERFFERDGNPQIADDEYSDQFFFQVSPEGDSFLLEGEDLSNSPTAFNVFCFCAPSDVFEITDGSISGEEVGGVWRISVDITYSRGVRDAQTGEVTEVHSDVLIFEGLFLAKERPLD